MRIRKHTCKQELLAKHFAKSPRSRNPRNPKKLQFSRICRKIQPPHILGETEQKLTYQ
jgi:hypothetical protein